MIKIKLNDLPSKYGTIKQILVEQGSHVKAFQNILCNIPQMFCTIKKNLKKGRV